MEGRRIYRPVGCEKCFYTGYRGRKAIYEIIPIDDDIRTCIRDENADIDRIISNKGISNFLRQDTAAVFRRHIS